MNDLRRRKIDVVVVWALDRLARSLKQLLSIAEESRLLSVDLVSEFEREMLRERVRAGMAQARRSGKIVGRPAKRKFLPSEIEELRLLRFQGTSVRKLAAEFKTTQWMAARLIHQQSATARQDKSDVQEKYMAEKPNALP